MKIRHRIKLLRLLFGLTQDELVSLAGISRPSLVNYEQGEYNPIDDIVIRLADIFDVEPGYLRYGSPMIRNHVWIPSIPKHFKRKQAIYDEFEKLFPEFIQENAFTCLVTGKLADGNHVLLFGENKNFDCLLLTPPDLADHLIATLKGLEQYKIADNPIGTVELFDDNCILFILTEVESFGFTLYFNQMAHTLTRVAAIKNRSFTILDAVAMEYAAKHDNLVRERLLRIANAISIDFTGGVTLEQLVEEQGKHASSLNVSSYSDPVSKTLLVVLKTACDLLASGRK